MLKDPVKTKNEIVEWIREYFEQNGKGCKAVIGISGGKDSSIAAALCAEALGKDRVVGVLMPNGVQSDISDSVKLVEFLGIPYVELNIGGAFQAMKEMLTSNKDLLALSGTDGITRDTEINLPQAQDVHPLRSGTDAARRSKSRQHMQCFRGLCRLFHQIRRCGRRFQPSFPSAGA